MKHRAGKEGAGDPINAERHALKIAVEVAGAWHRGGGQEHADIPLGVVATLAAASIAATRRDALLKWLRDRTPAEFVGWARWVWREVLLQCPDVVRMAAPVLGWLTTDGKRFGDRIKRTADAALTAGLLDLTGGDRRFDADLFGPVLGALRAPAAATVNAQMYTPGDVAVALTAVMLDDVQPGKAFCDDAVGTGGLFRAAAQVVRDRDINPATMTWYGADVDELAVAAAAVNGLIWQLGSNVVLYVGDPLTDSDWQTKAAQQHAQFQREVKVLQGLSSVMDLQRRT